MREHYEGTHKYSDPMVTYIDARDAYDQTSGDVESPTGWFGVAGRWLITCDERGYMSGEKWTSRAMAAEAFRALDDEYAAWGDDS